MCGEVINPYVTHICIHTSLVSMSCSILFHVILHSWGLRFSSSFFANVMHSQCAAGIKSKHEILLGATKPGAGKPQAVKRPQVATEAPKVDQ